MVNYCIPGHRCLSTCTPITIFHQFMSTTAIYYMGYGKISVYTICSVLSRHHCIHAGHHQFLILLLNVLTSTSTDTDTCKQQECADIRQFPTSCSTKNQFVQIKCPDKLLRNFDILSKHFKI